MPLTIVNKNGKAPEVKGAVYPNSTTALAFSPITTFKTRACSNTGVFPDVAFAGSSIATHYHIHMITFAGVVVKVCVTFSKIAAAAAGAQTADAKVADGHVAWAFYAPDAAAAGTFNRYLQREFDAAMRAQADAALTEFLAACPTIPAATANNLIVAFLNQQAATKAEEEQQKKKQAEKGAAATVISGSAKDRALLGQSASILPPRSETAVDAIMLSYKNGGGAAIDDKDRLLVRSALKNRTAKWNMLIVKYQPGFAPYLTD